MPKTNQQTQWTQRGLETPGISGVLCLLFSSGVIFCFYSFLFLGCGWGSLLRKVRWEQASVGSAGEGCPFLAAEGGGVCCPLSLPKATAAPALHAPTQATLSSAQGSRAPCVHDPRSILSFEGGLQPISSSSDAAQHLRKPLAWYLVWGKYLLP